jgi:uncharacterized protein
MSDLDLWQQLLVCLIFTWSGFVRSGLGFGGALMAMPFLLLIDNRPLVYLPIIAIHLLIFASITVLQNHRQRENSAGGSVDWRYLKRALVIMIGPKLAGVFGLITLPNQIMSGIIFTIVAVYSFTYILDKPFRSNNSFIDVVFLGLGAYISGTSLIGAPLIMAVFANHVARTQLRDTLFVLWFILVTIKMIAFVLADVDLQWWMQLWLLPAATLGHILGLRFHDYLLGKDNKVFFRVLGSVLLFTSILGIGRMIMA